MSSVAPVSAPSVSVVVAVDGDGRWERCLEALAAQRSEAIEVLVAGAGIAPASLEAAFPFATVVPAAGGLLVPELWALGMKRARGDVVAITTTLFAPAPGWLAVMRAAHARLRAAAIGGPILPPRGGAMSDWATYFLRYSAFAGYSREQEVPDLAGDNASYRRDVLDAHGEPAAGGFWELDLHRRLVREGSPLIFVPEMAVTQVGSAGVGAFLAQRLRHGRQFGAERARAFGTIKRLLAAAALPLIPLLFLRKIVARVLASGKDLGPFLFSMPLLLCFLCAWAVGESWGYLTLSPGAERGHR